jgi:hypothetical protein
MWQDIPGYPGYQISSGGVVRTTLGYKLTRYGRCYHLFRHGKQENLRIDTLLSLAFPPDADAPLAAQIPAEPVTQPDPAPRAEPDAEAIPASPGLVVPKTSLKNPQAIPSKIPPPRTNASSFSVSESSRPRRPLFVRSPEAPGSG